MFVLRKSYLHFVLVRFRFMLTNSSVVRGYNVSLQCYYSTYRIYCYSTHSECYSQHYTMNSST